MDTSISAQRVAAGRRSFFDEGRAPSGVRPEIATSWQRCSSWSVPVGEPEPHYLPGVNTESRLLRAARPVLDQVSERLGDLSCVFLVTDPEARIVDRRVCESALTDRLDSVRALAGFVFAEDVVGTNAMGTAVELRRTTRVDGGEHYAERYRNFTCVGVPIIDRIGRELVGVLDVSCPTDPDNKLITLLAEQTARGIEERLTEERSRSERALLDEFLIARRGGSGVVVVSDRLLMTDPQAARLLNGVEQPLLWERASKALGRNGFVEDELPSAGGGSVASRMRSLHVGGEEIGVLIQVLPRPRAAVPRPAHIAQPRPIGVVGVNPAFVEAYQRCRAAGDVVVVSGEAGTGKTEVLRAVHRERSTVPVVVHDVADMAPGEESRRLHTIRDSLGGVPGLLILRHAHLLAADIPLSATVRAVADTGWRVGITYTSRAQTDGSVLPDVDGCRVGIPPLRNRPEDVADLIAAFAAPRRLAPEAVQLLLRLSWPGNVRELRTVVEGMVAGRSSPVLGLSDVPAQLRQAAPRRQLTRFERSEVHTILEAMAESGGNKKSAARLLGISRSTLYRKLQAAGIDLDNTVW
ncbi:MAG TPA: helix-turn-helix domain-containing protein [Pseudonocardia sp.]